MAVLNISTIENKEKSSYIFLTVDNKDGTIHIVKDTIYAPDIIIALISALKHSVEVLKVAKVFYPILDDYVELFVEEWRRAYSEATKNNND